MHKQHWAARRIQRVFRGWRTRRRVVLQVREDMELLVADIRRQLDGDWALLGPATASSFVLDWGADHKLRLPRMEDALFGVSVRFPDKEEEHGYLANANVKEQIDHSDSVQVAPNDPGNAAITVPLESSLDYQDQAHSTFENHLQPADESAADQLDHQEAPNDPDKAAVIAPLESGLDYQDQADSTFENHLQPAEESDADQLDHQEAPNDSDKASVIVPLKSGLGNQDQVDNTIENHLQPVEESVVNQEAMNHSLNDPDKAAAIAPLESGLDYQDQVDSTFVNLVQPADESAADQAVGPQDTSTAHEISSNTSTCDACVSAVEIRSNSLQAETSAESMNSALQQTDKDGKTQLASVQPELQVILTTHSRAEILLEIEWARQALRDRRKYLRSKQRMEHDSNMVIA